MRTLLSLSLLFGFASLCAGGSPSAPPKAPPTEAMTIVVSPDAPLLNELEDDEPAAEVAHAGELLEVVKPIPALKATWRARMGDAMGERDGPMAEVRWTPGGGNLFGFQVDLGETVEIPSAQWTCEQIGRDASLPEAARHTRCATLLRRVRLQSGAILAFAQCSAGPCPVALLGGGKVTAIAVDGVVSAKVVPGGKDGILLLTTRWSRANGQWTGGTLVPVALASGTLKRLADIELDEVDARHAAKVTSRDVTVAISQPTPGHSLVRVSGRRREVNRADARELASAPIDERRSIP